ncbi:MAG TPA: ATP-binding protein [Rhodothermales bacterium]|nr:ATP-binding protein [Rhodothermales bacterium]
MTGVPHLMKPELKPPLHTEMPQGIDTFAPLEPELLVATFVSESEASYRDHAWENAFGDEPNAWARLDEEDQNQARTLIADALNGRLATNQIFTVESTERDEPLPVLLNFIPVEIPSKSSKRNVVAVTVAGEILAEPTSWTTSQTHRARMETLGRMTMGIAHDFNNLLSGILGHTELMKSASDAEYTPGELRENIRTIERAAHDGAALVRKIQQYIRQEKHDRFEPVDLPSLIEDCVALTRPYWYNEPRRQGIAIDAELEFLPVPKILGSPTELREVFVNLILNAVQAMPHGGKLRFETSFGADHRVVVRVRDTGAGMPENVRRRIFEPLYTTKGDSGTGMGLAVSYGIIQAHDGDIEVASEPGTGTEFTISLPPASTDTAESAPRDERKPGRKARILVVDDEKMVRTILKKLLSLNGHTVADAESGPQALALVETETFDIVFTDNGMPDMNGRELARLLREGHPDLPIVLLTGDTETGEADEIINTVLAKPFTREQLESAIQLLLPSETAVS